MKYDVISADCHVDLIWLPPDLFTANAPRRVQGPHALCDRGPRPAANGSPRTAPDFGLMNGMGSAGRQYVPGEIHRSDRMASTGLYDDGKKGIRRLDRPGSAPEGPGPRRRPGRGAVRHPRRDRCRSTTTRPPARCCASTTTGSPVSAPRIPTAMPGSPASPTTTRRRPVAEIERVAQRGVVRGLEIARRHDMTPLWDPWWNPVWDADRGERAAGAFPHDRRRAAAISRSSAARPCWRRAPPASPAFRCTWPTC